MGYLHLQLLLLTIILSPKSLSLSWPFFSSSSSSSSSSTTPRNNGPLLKGLTGETAKFTMESLSDSKGSKLVENAKRKLSAPDTCWHNAYRNLFASCSEIVADKEKQSRLAWLLSDCFQTDSGRAPFPNCDLGSTMMKCLRKLDDFEHKIYLEFFLETNSICHQLQTDSFKHEMERLVNDLAKSARFAEDKLEIMEERSDQLLQDSNRIHDSLTSIDLQTEQLAQTSTVVKAQIHDVLKHSEAIFEQSKGIAVSQLDLKEGQIKMKEAVESGMALLQESYEGLGDGMEKLKNETIEIEREVKAVRDSLTSKMQNLQSTADDIGNVAGLSLEKQKRLLDGQAMALEGLDFLTKFQSQALEESRDTLNKLAEFGQKQQEELLRRQEQIQQAHDRLIQNSQSILAAQEEFELKQANIFAALDKLFALHNAILVESRFIKAFFFYSCVMFLLHMLTGTKQTSDIRARLYFGLCITLGIEIMIVRNGDFHEQTWIMSTVFVARSSFLVVAAIQILYSIFTYRNYEIMNHQLLQTLVEKSRYAESNSGSNKLCMETDSSMSDYSWIDDELPEDVDLDEDPNYVLPEEIGENCITAITRRYDLRPRSFY